MTVMGLYCLPQQHGISFKATLSFDKASSISLMFASDYEEQSDVTAQVPCFPSAKYDGQWRRVEEEAATS